MPAGAAPTLAPTGYSINWKAVYCNARRLQARIVKAVREGRWNKVKALVYLLTHSFSGRALAILQSSAIRCTDSGVDGILWNTPEAKSAAFKTLHRHGYRPQPLRRVYIPKSSGTQLRLGNPDHDRPGHAGSLPARPRPNRGDASRQQLLRLSAVTILCRRSGPMSRDPEKSLSADWILEGDIKACFDRISHTWLLNHIPMDKDMLSKWLQAGFIDKHALVATTEGTPQGGIASCAGESGPEGSKGVRSIWSVMRMTSSSPAHHKVLLKQKSNLSWHTSSPSGVSNSPTRKPASRISRTALTFLAKPSAVSAVARS